MKNKVILLFLLAIVASCGEPESEKEKPVVTEPAVKPESMPQLPEFNSDSAYKFIEKQVSFGPRVPNSDAHKKCASYLEKSLKKYGLSVNVQQAVVKAYNDDKLYIKNIMGQFNPEASERIMLFAHWDTRPYADEDKTNPSKPADGANDGASGVGVLLEVARLLSVVEKKPGIGVDVVFFDAEDYGQPHNYMGKYQPDSWCLGSQYWAKNIPIPNYKPRYGILLDMVGAPNSMFPKEGKSVNYAGYVVDKVWNIASRLGYSSFFSNEIIDFVGSDDHVYINQIAKIPSIDIIHYDPARQGFGSYHHTHADNMSIIDKSTLKAVGQTLIGVIYLEK